MSVTFQSLTEDPRFVDMNAEDQKGALDRFYDEEEKGGRATPLDRFIGQNSVALRKEFYNETPRRQKYTQEKWNALTQLYQDTESSTSAQRKIGVMNYVKREQEINKKLANEFETSALKYPLFK